MGQCKCSKEEAMPQEVILVVKGLENKEFDVISD